MVLLDVVRLLAAIALAFVPGKLVAKLNLPSILGWLITGMILGPHAWNLLSDSVLGSAWFNVTESLLECTVGLMIGTELLWHQMKKAGAQIVVTTITESLGTFLVVSLVFGAIFWATGTPIYLAFIFGGIALATAPAPSLSIVSQMRTSGPVTRTLIPMAALDDLVGAFVFFMVIAFVSAHVSTAGVPVGVVIFLVFLPVFIGIATGFLAGKLMQKAKTARGALAVMLLMLLVSAGIGFAINSMLSTPVLNAIYPVAIVLIVLSFLPKPEKHGAVYRLCIAFTAVQSIAAAFPIPVLSPLLRALPLNALGFGWLIPAAVGLLIGLLLPKKTEKA